MGIQYDDPGGYNYLEDFKKRIGMSNSMLGDVSGNTSTLTPEQPHDFSTGNNVLTPQQFQERGMSQVAPGKWVNNSMKEYYNGGDGQIDNSKYVAFGRQNIPGLSQAGNIDIKNRPKASNNNSISTVRSIGINANGKEYLIPTVSDDGRIMTNEDAIKQFQTTGRHLGQFDSREASDAYAKLLHNDQEQRINKQGSPIMSNTTTPVQSNAFKELFNTELTKAAQPEYKPTWKDKLPMALGMLSNALNPRGQIGTNLMNYANEQMVRKQNDSNMALDKAVKLAQIQHLTTPQTKPAGTKNVIMQAPDGSYRNVLVNEITGEKVADLGAATKKMTGDENSINSLLNNIKTLSPEDMELYKEIKGLNGRNANLDLAKKIAQQEIDTGTIKPADKDRRTLELSRSTLIPTSEGYTYVNPTGTTIQTGIKKVMPASETTDLAKYNTVLDSISKIRDLYDPSYTGWYEGRKGNVAGQMGLNTDKQNLFRAAVATLQKSYMDVAGKNFTEMEKKILQPYMVDTTDSDNEFMAKLNNFESNYKSLINNKLKALENAGYGTQGFQNAESVASKNSTQSLRKPLSAFEVR